MAHKLFALRPVLKKNVFTLDIFYKCFHIDRASVPSPIAIEILMVHNGEGQSSHVLVFCVNLELLEIILFTLKSNYYVYIAVLSLQYICC